MTVLNRRSVPRLLTVMILIALSITIGCTKEPAENAVPTTRAVTQQSETPAQAEPTAAGEDSESSASAGASSMVEYLEAPVTLEERFSYTYGYLLMVTAMRDVQGIDPVYFARGALDSGLSESPLIPTDAMNNVLYEYQDKLITEAARRLEELAKKNLEDAESFLAINGKREGVFTTASGLQYEVVKASEGDNPSETDTVQVHYRLTYLDGREGDASVRGIPSTFNLSSLIPGFREGLMLMTAGSQFRFYVHPSLGYGEAGSSRIEPNTLLIFDVELVSISR